MPTRAVIFDLYGTLVKQPSMDVRRSLLAEMAAAMDIPDRCLRRCLDGGLLGAPDRRLRHGGADTSSTSPDVSASPPTPSASPGPRPGRPGRSTGRACKRCAPDALDTLRALKDAGLRLALLSNCGVGIPKVWAESSMAPFIDVPVFSSTVRL